VRQVAEVAEVAEEAEGDWKGRMGRIGRKGKNGRIGWQERIAGGARWGRIAARYWSRVLAGAGVASDACWSRSLPAAGRSRCENSLALVCLDQVIKGMKR
jgi:hypothetical protein